MSSENCALEALIAPPTRAQLLAELERQPLSVSELEDEVDATRRSVRRNLNQLEQDGWIRGPDGSYRLVSPASCSTDSLRTRR